jgi:hypothetical protein
MPSSVRLSVSARSIFTVAVLVALAVFGALAVPSGPAQAQGRLCLPGFKPENCELLSQIRLGGSARGTLEVGIDFSLKVSGARGGLLSYVYTGTGPVDLSAIKGTSARAILDDILFDSVGILSTSGVGLPSGPGAFELMVVKGTAYFKLPSSNAQSSRAQPWYKVTIKNLLASNPRDPNPDLSAYSSLLRPGDVSDTLRPFALGSISSGPAVDGVSTTAYTVMVDLAGLYASLSDEVDQNAFLVTFFRDMSNIAGVRVRERIDLFSRPDLRAALERTLRTAKLSFTWITDDSERTLRGFEINGRIQIDALVGKYLSRAFTAGITTVDLHVQLLYSKFGQKVELSAPSNALDLTRQFLPSDVRA